MATIAEKYRKIRISPSIQIGQRQNWIEYVENYGWVWSEERSDWSITVSSGTFWGQDLTKERWRELIQQYVDEHRDKYGYVSKTGTFDLKWDSELNAYYYIDTLGKKIYDYSKGQNPLTDSLIGESIRETPNYDFNETINDILGNPISPKPPEAGLYDNKNYFDLLTKTRKQYKDFWLKTNITEKVNALEERATDIVTEEGRLINLLAIAQKAKATDSIVIYTISLATSLFGGTTGKAASVSVNAAVKFAQSQTTDKRIVLIGKDLEYINTEYEAIKAYFDQQNVNSKVTSANGFGSWLVKNWALIVAATVSVFGMIYFIRKRNKSN